jgi:hypothetical protein
MILLATYSFQFYSLNLIIFACNLLHVGFLLGLFFDPEDGGDVPPKCGLTFNGLYRVISQTTERF